MLCHPGERGIFFILPGYELQSRRCFIAFSMTCYELQIKQAVMVGPLNHVCWALQDA
jgi:hypothetical protein